MRVDRESRGERLGRRLRTVPAMVAGFLLVTALLPLLLLALLAYDSGRALGGRGRFSAVRLVLFGWTYLAVEMVGLVTMLFFWLLTGFGKARKCRAIGHEEDEHAGFRQCGGGKTGFHGRPSENVMVS